MNKFWLTQGGRVTTQVNVARWLEWAIPALTGWSFGAGCMLLIARRAGWTTRPIGYITVLAVGVIAGFAFRRIQRTWFTREDGLVRLDAVLGLHNRLTSAAVGVGPWPAPVPDVKSGFPIAAQSPSSKGRSRPAKAAA